MQPHRLNIYALRSGTNNARFCAVGALQSGRPRYGCTRELAAVRVLQVEPGIRRAVVAGIALATVLLVVTSQWDISVSAASGAG